MNDANGEPDRRRLAVEMKQWFLLTGNRLIVAAVMLAGIAGSFFAAGLLGLATVTTPNRVMWFLNGTVNGLLTLVPIAVGVNQIVLSQEFGSIKNLYDRRRDISGFRKRVERRTGATVSSPRASAFFRTFLSAVSETAASFRRECERNGDSPADEIETYVRSVTGEADETRERLPEREFEMLDTLLVVLDYDDSIQMYQTRQLRSNPDLDLSDEATAKLYELEELFTEIDAVRQYLKTVLVERQLARLSRLLIYTGIPAVAVAALGIFTYRDVAGLTLSHSVLVVVAGMLVAVTLVPLAVLASYILRVATIARQTAAFGPFVPEPDHRGDDDRET
jgi:hypothetical protein